MIVVGTTLCTFAMSDFECWSSWLSNAEALAANSPEPVHFFAAIEVDARGMEPFSDLIKRLDEIGGSYWTFSLDDGRTEITTKNRLRHITMGQNLVSDFCSTPGVSHLLFLAADCKAPDDAIPKLLEVNHPLVGGEVKTYCLHGNKVEGYPFPLEEHMATAAFIFIRRDIFKRLRWRWDTEENMTDDPCYHYDAKDLLGVTTYVRKDCIGKHYPESVGGIETRGYDMSVVREQV